MLKLWAKEMLKSTVVMLTPSLLSIPVYWMFGAEGAIIYLLGVLVLGGLAFIGVSSWHAAKFRRDFPEFTSKGD